jgi:hypothetical protein
LLGFKLWLLLFVAAIKQLFGAYIFAVIATALLLFVEQTAGTQQKAYQQKGKKKTGGFHKPLKFRTR